MKTIRHVSKNLARLGIFALTLSTTACVAQTGEEATAESEDEALTQAVDDSLMKDMTDEAQQDRILAATRDAPTPLVDDSMDDALDEVAAMKAPAAVPDPNANGDAYYHCASLLANEAYKPAGKRSQTMCGSFGLHKILDWDRTVVYAVPGSPQFLLVAFRGTSDKRDIGTDISSMKYVQHKEFLYNTPNSPGRVGKGWEAYMYGEVYHKDSRGKFPLWSILNSPKIVTNNARIHVFGHSLGAAVAELFAFDVNAAEVLHKNAYVHVTAFNPPKLGNMTMTKSYQAALMHFPHTFELAQFSRSGDAVHNIPKNFSDPFYHPVWNWQPGDHHMNEGSTQSLPYCPQYNMSGYRLPLKAHSMGDWPADIQRMPGNAKCLADSQATFY